MPLENVRPDDVLPMAERREAGRGSSVKPSHAANGNLKHSLIGYTRQVWQPRLGRDLSCEDARQIAENMTGFFSVLAEWSRAERPTPANGSTRRGQPAAGGIITGGDPPGKRERRSRQEAAHMVKSNKSQQNHNHPMQSSAAPLGSGGVP